jgi:hypothetical protein
MTIEEMFVSCDQDKVHNRFENCEQYVAFGLASLQPVTKGETATLKRWLEFAFRERQAELCVMRKH